MADAYVMRGRASSAQKQFQKAISDYNTAILIDPKSALGFYHRGWVYKHLKKFAPALNDLSQTIALDPKFKAPYKYRAQIFMVRKEWPKAIADYTTALSLNKNYDDARLGRAWANFQLGNAQEGERDYAFLIGQKKHVGAAHAFRGLARLLQFRDKEAQQDFEMARAINKAENHTTPEKDWKMLMEQIAKAKARRRGLRH